MKMGKITHGFTLMEVLVALAILAMAYTSIFMSISSNAKALRYIEDKTAMEWVGLNIMTLTQLGRSHSGVNSGKESMFNKDWYWAAHSKSSAVYGVSQVNIWVKESLNSQTLIQIQGYQRMKDD